VPHAKAAGAAGRARSRAAAPTAVATALIVTGSIAAGGTSWAVAVGLTAALYSCYAAARAALDADEVVLPGPHDLRVPPITRPRPRTAAPSAPVFARRGRHWDRQVAALTALATTCAYGAVAVLTTHPEVTVVGAQWLVVVTAAVLATERVRFRPAAT
jgi:hypothetical protein